jgi:hypothetical protein
VLAGFDRELGEAEQLLAARPLRDSLSAVEIKRLAEIYYASMLDIDETVRREGTGTELGFQSIAAQLIAAGIEPKTRFSIGALPEAGLSDREVFKRAEHLAWELDVTADALARGDTTAIREELDELLDVYQINLDPKCEAYRGHCVDAGAYPVSDDSKPETIICAAVRASNGKIIRGHRHNDAMGLLRPRDAGNLMQYRLGSSPTITANLSFGQGPLGKANLGSFSKSALALPSGNESVTGAVR